MKKIYLYFFLIPFLSVFVKAQKKSPLYKDPLQLLWVDKQYKSMSLEEKVGQLFVVAAYSNKDTVHEKAIQDLIIKEHIGGLIFMQDKALHQIELINKFQSNSKIPLLIGMDAEWGVAMRLKEVERFPWNITLGALKENALIYKMAKQIGKQANRVGIQLNFAPSIDVNVNPENPIIGNRSFGSDPKRVAEKGIVYMQGLKSENVLSSAKHFPGHGNTDMDSHKTLPTIPDNKRNLEKYHVQPFKKLIASGVQSIMVAHLNVPALEPDKKLPSTLSKKIITDYLKKELNFKGLIITDALNMDAVAKMYKPGDVDYKAFLAGNDILLFSENVHLGKQKIIEAIQKGEISESRLEESVKKILMAKYITGLSKPKVLSTKNVMNDLNEKENTSISSEIYQKASTVIKNKKRILPLKEINKKIAFLPLEQNDYETYLNQLNTYYNNIQLVSIDSVSQIKLLHEFDVIIVGAFLSNKTVYEPYKLSDNSIKILNALPRNKRIIFSLFSSPYALRNLDFSFIDAITIHYQNTKEAQIAAAKIIFGKKGANGVLPVDVNKCLKAGDGIKTVAH